MIEIEKKEEIKIGKCDLLKNNCTAKEKGNIFSIFESKREIYVCENCLNTKLNNKEWILKNNS